MRHTGADMGVGAGGRFGLAPLVIAPAHHIAGRSQRTRISAASDDTGVGARWRLGLPVAVETAAAQRAVSKQAARESAPVGNLEEFRGLHLSRGPRIQPDNARRVVTDAGDGAADEHTAGDPTPRGNLPEFAHEGVIRQHVRVVAQRRRQIGRARYRGHNRRVPHPSRHLGAAR